MMAGRRPPLIECSHFLLEFGKSSPQCFGNLKFSHLVNSPISRMRKTVASQVRRFRPGLDYTVAARGALSESHEAAFSW